MVLELHGRGSAAGGAVRDHVERRLAFALGRMRRWIRRIRVFLTRLGGARTGVTRRCLMIVDLAGAERVVVDHRDTGWRAAIDTAAGRLGRTIRRRLALRRRDRVTRRGLARKGESDALSSL